MPLYFSHNTYHFLLIRVDSVCTLLCFFVLVDDPSIPGRQGYLLLMDKVDIRSIQPNGRRPRKLVRELAQTFAIDYHMR